MDKEIDCFVCSSAKLVDVPFWFLGEAYVGRGMSRKLPELVGVVVMFNWIGPGAVKSRG